MRLKRIAAASEKPDSSSYSSTTVAAVIKYYLINKQRLDIFFFWNFTNGSSSGSGFKYINFNYSSTFLVMLKKKKI